MAKLFVPVIHGAALDRPDETDTVRAAESIAACLKRLGFATEVIALDCGLEALAPLAGRKPFVVFNLVEALGGEANKASAALRRLDQLQVPYTGARYDAYDASTSKLKTKAILTANGLPTPAHWLTGGAIPAAARTIVKSIDEHGSYGIDQHSVVEGCEAAGEIARREARFGGRFFAEVYVEGREFNVSVIETHAGPLVLPIAEIDFSTLPPGILDIVDFAAKWEVDAPSYHLTPRRFGLENNEPGLAAEISRLSLACWEALDLSGYARVDFRVDNRGAPLILEVNANPCLSEEAGFAAAAAEAGLDYDDIIAAIVDAGAQGREDGCPT